MNLFTLLAIANGGAVLLTGGCLVALLVLHGPLWAVLLLAGVVALQGLGLRASVRAARAWRTWLRTGRLPGGRSPSPER